MRRDLSIILQLGSSYALIFSAFNSQGFIEIPVLRKIAQISPSTGITEQSGYYSLSIIYFIFTLSNLIIPPIVKLLGSKWSQVLGATCYLIFLATFLHLNVLFLYAGSAILGFGASLLWTGNGCYMVEFSRDGKLKRNTGIIWAMLQSSLITGGIFLIYILQYGDLTSSYKVVYLVFTIITAIGILNLIFLPSYPPQYDHQSDNTLSSSRENLVDSVDSVDQVVEVLGNSGDGELHSQRNQSFLDYEQMQKTFQLMKTKEMLSLSTVFMYTGLVVTFNTGVYAACLSATSALKSYSDLIIPYSALAMGAGQIISGSLQGFVSSYKTIKLHHTVFAAMLGHLVAFFLSFLILPYDSTIHKSDLDTYMAPTLFTVLLIAFLLGFSDGFWQTQIYSVLGSHYKTESESAFAIFKFFQSLASCVSFYYSAHFYLHWQLLIMTVGCFMTTVVFLKYQYNEEFHSDDEYDELENEVSI